MLGGRGGLCNFRAKNLDIREEETRSFSSMHHVRHALHHFGTASPGGCRGGGRPALEVCREVGGEEEKRRICCGRKLRVHTPPCLFELDLIK